jgi:phenylalanyl-tRNA synthetase beta chain
VRLPLSWIREYVDVDLDPADLAHRLTMAGLEVEDVERIGRDWERMVVARVSALEPHPSMPYLHVARVDLEREQLTLVTAAANLAVGNLVPVALPGGRVMDQAVEVRDFSGVVSQGMLLSADELGLGAERDGIYVLDVEARPGQSLVDVLGDVVLDLTLTPNRVDAMSAIGVAREIAALTGQRLRYPALQPLAGGPPASELISVEIADPDLCPRYSAAVVLGVTVGPAPAWMRRRLHLSGVRPISNIVDVTNYVMLEMGQPLHGFDRALLQGGLVIRRARAGERMRTLDGQQRELTPEMLVIADHQRPQALAGVMGGEDSEVSERTRDVIIESANFNPISIRRTSRSLRLGTEASRRFERSLDPGQTARAAQRAANLMAQLADGAAASGVVDVYPSPERARQITVTPGWVSSFLGKDYGAQEIERVLTHLEFTVQHQDGTLEVTVPGHRRDVEGRADLAEEVARITGYESIPDTLPAGRLPEPVGTSPREAEMLAKRTLSACGLQEVITYSLVNPALLTRLQADASWPPVSQDSGPVEDQAAGAEASPPTIAPPIHIFNPMSSEESALRTTLLGSLLRTLETNLRYASRVAVFELAHVYLPPLDPLPTEVRRLGVALVGPRHTRAWSLPEDAVDFFDLKGILEQLARAFGIALLEWRRARHPTFHPGQCAELVVAGPNGARQTLGVLGQVHPRVAERFDIERQQVFAAELDFEVLSAVARDVQRVAAPPRFPAVTIDLAIQVPEAVEHQDVLQVMQQGGGPLLERIELFDVYRGTPLQAGTKSLAYALMFRSPERTLADADVVGFQERIEQALAERLGAVIRGRG